MKNSQGIICAPNCAQQYKMDWAIFVRKKYFFFLKSSKWIYNLKEISYTLLLLISHLFSLQENEIADGNFFYVRETQIEKFKLLPEVSGRTFH